MNWNDLLTIASVIITVGGATAVLKGWISPFKNYKDKLDNNIEQTNKHAKLLDNDNKRLALMEQTDKMICKTQLAMLDHFITGNGIDKLKQVKTELQDYIINKN